ncbi:hypothetical protein PHMEG_00021576 [Phytophthora megakarya]|uniref:Uncharacterized protein n=1 Tax=Phytophthora megakarya TaxID=4795 RepID=A0A225VLJ2_9STRA|nr:hypothetical protein PHMEG_00021576 [Phytophthora megakarya]
MARENFPPIVYNPPRDIARRFHDLRLSYPNEGCFLDARRCFRCIKARACTRGLPRKSMISTSKQPSLMTFSHSGNYVVISGVVTIHASW